MLCTVPELLLKEVVDVFGEQAWARLSAVEKMGRVFNFIIKMNDTKSVLYGQVLNLPTPKLCVLDGWMMNRHTNFNGWMMNLHT